MLFASVTLVLLLLLQNMAKGAIFNLPIIGWPKGDELCSEAGIYYITNITGAGTYLAYYTRLM